MAPAPVAAKDALMATVTANGFTFEENGNPLSPGTYAIGTLKIFMIVSADEWPADLGVVMLDMAIREGSKPKPATMYDVPILLRQAGGELVLTPNADEFTVTGIGWSDSSDIHISVPQEILDDDAYNADGTQLVANLQIEPTVPGKHLDTVTTVKIFAKLVHPDATACLRTVAFISDNGLSDNLSLVTDGLALTYKVTPGFSFQNVSPPQPLYDVLVVNSCTESKSFDLDLAVDPGFSVPGTGQPVKAYISTNAAVTPDDLIDTFQELQNSFGGDYGGAMNNGSDLCLANITLGGMHSLYAQADVDLITSGFTSFANLPAEGMAYDQFLADVLSVNASACTGGTHPDSDGQASAIVRILSVTCTGGGCP